MIIDGLIYLGRSRFGYGLSLKELMVGLSSGAVDGAVVAPMHRPDHDFGAANEDVFRAAEESAHRLVSLARVDPWDGEAAVRMLDEAVSISGARGLFLHPLEEHFRINDPRVRPLARRAADLGIPIVVATGYQGFSEPVQITQLARWCPEVPIILTNGGQFNISGLSQIDAELALQYENVYAQTSGVYRDDWISLVVSSFGADRLLFASAAPVMNTAYELKRVQLAHIPSEAKNLILHGNVQRLFGEGRWAI